MSDLIWELEAKHDNIFFVLDDVCNDVMTEKVLIRINWCFHDVIIIQKSMTTERKFIKEGETHSLESNNIKNLNDDFEHHHLPSVMRLSKENHALVECTEKLIQERTVEIRVQTKSKLSAEISPIVSHVVNDSMATHTDKNDHDDSHLGKSESHPVKSRNVGDDSCKRNSIIFDFDMALSKLPNVQTSTSDTQDKITTSFSFVYGPTGHNISGKKPKLVFLPVACCDEVITVLLSFIISEYFGSRFPLFIANSLRNAKTLYHAAKTFQENATLYIPYLQEIQPAVQEKDQILRDISNSSILITDHRSFLGMESESVITIIDPNEKQGQHSLVEIISRCTNELLIFVHPFTDERKPETVGNIIKDWGMEEGLVEKKYVIIQTDIEAKSGIQMCNENTSHIKVFTQSEEFLSRLNLIGNYDNKPFINTNTEDVYRYDLKPL